MERKKNRLATRLPPIQRPISTTVQPTQITNPRTTPSLAQIRRSHTWKPTLPVSDQPSAAESGYRQPVRPRFTPNGTLPHRLIAQEHTQTPSSDPKKIQKIPTEKNREIEREIGTRGCSHRRRGGERKGRRRRMRPDSSPREPRGGGDGGGGGGRKAHELWRRSCWSLVCIVSARLSAGSR